MPDEEVTPEAVRSAASLMGRVKSPAKAAAARENAKHGGRRPGTTLTPEHRAKIAEAARRRASEKPKADPADGGPKKRGRPKKEAVAADAAGNHPPNAVNPSETVTGAETAGN